MSSKEDILKRIHANTRQQYDMPDLSLNAIVYEDKLKTFIEVLKAAGGEVYVMQPDDDLNAVIRRFYPEAQRIGSSLNEITCATFNPDELEDPRELNGTDVSVVKGEFGVAENAAVWLPCQYRYKAVYFISNALVILFVSIACVLHAILILIVQPHFELGSFFFADNDLSVIGRNNTNQHFAVKIRFYPLDSIYSQNELSVCSEKMIRI